MRRERGEVPRHFRNLNQIITMADTTSRASTADQVAESGPQPIRPSDIHAVWKEACVKARIKLEGCSWNILDAIYHGAPESVAEVEEVLRKEAGNVEYYFAKSGREQAFDCDNAAFMLRERLNKRALRKRMTTSYCFGIAVLRAKTVSLSEQPADLIGAPDEHVVNWLITASKKGLLELRLVQVVDGGTGARSMNIKTRSGKIKVKVPVLQLQDFEAVAGDVYSSVQMIIV